MQTKISVQSCIKLQMVKFKYFCFTSVLSQLHN